MLMGLVTWPGRTPALACWLLTVTLGFSALSLVDPPSARADSHCEWVTNETGYREFKCEEIQPGEGGNDGGGNGGEGSSEPPCGLSQIEQFSGATEQFCEGQNACWINNPPFEYPTRESWPEEPPAPQSEYIYKYCEDPNGNVIFDDYTWTNMPDTPSVEELALEAYGELSTPAFTLAFSPPDEAVIYIPTWWWADGATEDEITSSAALGVVAIAEPDHLEVDPGDGSSTITCDFVVNESDACTHTFERASGDIGYPARARLVYDVHFEQNGQRLDFGDLPTTFESPWAETTVPVTEVQGNIIR